MYDYSKLRGRIVEVFHTQGEFARALGVSRSALCMKLNNRCRFSQDEIAKAIRLLDVGQLDVYSLFFTEIV